MGVVDSLQELQTESWEAPQSSHSSWQETAGVDWPGRRARLAPAAPTPWQEERQETEGTDLLEQETSCHRGIEIRR